ncbi:MAG: CPBP family intramembrane glutamic endopeptidase [Terracidiphilus sp.]
MSATAKGRPGFLKSVGLLLGAARKRSHGRRRRQQELLNKRGKGKATNFGNFGFFFFVLFMLFIHGAAAACVGIAVKAAQRAEAERQGKVVVSYSFLESLRNSPDDMNANSNPYSGFALEAKQISDQYGGSSAEIQRKLRRTFEESGTENFASTRVAAPGLKALAHGGLAACVGSITLLWWAVMLTFQGEGLEMDMQRRRHPMWEWVLSHPVPPGAMFLAEMLSPMAANPSYWGAPLFAGILFGITYDVGTGFIAAILIGVPLTVALACMGKALEIGVLLRCSPRSRGAIVGLMSWFGYTSLMLFAVGALFFVPKVVTFMAGFLSLLARAPWPWLGLFLGERPDGTFSFLQGLLTCWFAATVVTGGAVWFSVWATERGLSGQFDARVAAAGKVKQVHFGKDPLYRKEFLWFARDRSAIVQTILIPLSVAGLQVFNLRGLLAHAQAAWNSLCGVAIFFGTYFLWVLGPKSLQSEGSALWIALTWPRGLEELLKAKAWLWSRISSVLVILVLGYAAWVFPGDLWRIALVGVGWYFFSRSMAEKSVTLVTVTGESGETERVPKGRRWAAQLGMLTFAIGIVTGQWQLAIIGIVYSYITAAAMWQNFRARLPFLYDPWSEKLPQPPTLMHAMISISIMVEASAFLSGTLLALAGREHLALVQAFSYGISTIAISLLVANFLRNRDVRMQDIWVWRAEGEHTEESASWLRRYGLADGSTAPALLMGASGGMALGLLAHGYLFLLGLVPATAEILHEAQKQMAMIPNLHFWYMIMAVGFAPFAEEYLFRGLLFRALDREWGGWRAIVGSAAFFAIYHPVLSWFPVFLLGAANCMLFKKTGKLAPAVILHMLYNAVVLSG